MSNIVNLTSGSDASLQFAFKQSDNSPIVVTDPVIIDISQELAGRLTASLLDGPGGLVQVTLEGTDPLRIQRYYFRVQVTLADNTTLASERVTINVR